MCNTDSLVTRVITADTITAHTIYTDSLYINGLPFDSAVTQVAWALNGNTIQASHFLGTTNNQNLIFKRNTTTYQTFVKDNNNINNPVIDSNLIDINARIRIQGGTPANGNVLTAIDNNGTAQWKPTAPAMPCGTLLPWTGALADLPTGWVLCDGNNGTPDLRGRFIVGEANQKYDVDGDGNGGSFGNFMNGHYGGNQNNGYQLREEHIPQHNHNIKAAKDYRAVAGSGMPVAQIPIDGDGMPPNDDDFNTTPGQQNDFYVSTSNYGFSNPMAVPTVPLFYAMAYITNCPPFDFCKISQNYPTGRLIVTQQGFDPNTCNCGAWQGLSLDSSLVYNSPNAELLKRGRGAVETALSLLGNNVYNLWIWNSCMNRTTKVIKRDEDPVLWNIQLWRKL